MAFAFALFFVGVQTGVEFSTRTFNVVAFLAPPARRAQRLRASEVPPAQAGLAVAPLVRWKSTSLWGGNDSFTKCINACDETYKAASRAKTDTAYLAEEYGECEHCCGFGGSADDSSR